MKDKTIGVISSLMFWCVMVFAASDWLFKAVAMGLILLIVSWLNCHGKMFHELKILLFKSKGDNDEG